MKKVIVLFVVTTMAWSLQASIIIQDVQTLGMNTSNGEVGTNSYTVTANVGDMIVATYTSNKRGNVISIEMNQVGGTGATGGQTVLSNDDNTYPQSKGFYQTVTTAGDLSFDLTSGPTNNNVSALTAIYVIRADSGLIELAGSATWDDTDGTDEAAPYTRSLDYTFGSTVSNAVLIESISSRNDTVAAPGDYTVDRNSNPIRRVLLSYNEVNGSSWSSDYTLTNGTNTDQSTSGGLGMVFSEVIPEPGTLSLIILGVSLLTRRKKV